VEDLDNGSGDLSDRGLQRASAILSRMEKYLERGFNVMESRYMREVLEYVVHDATGNDAVMIS
jgi:hypothetical protein